mmetsp:Transcript_86887/g.243438  ORF Transcript_86887/g.243438 Transcript_86887/m.243438 type:complete len:289 (+) Transcript_86887:729-1595(+)
MLAPLVLFRRRIPRHESHATEEFEPQFTHGGPRLGLALAPVLDEEPCDRQPELCVGLVLLELRGVRQQRDRPRTEPRDEGRLRTIQGVSEGRARFARGPNEGRETAAVAVTAGPLPDAVEFLGARGHCHVQLKPHAVGCLHEGRRSGLGQHHETPGGASVPALAPGGCDGSGTAELLAGQQPELGEEWLRRVTPAQEDRLVDGTPRKGIIPALRGRRRATRAQGPRELVVSPHRHDGEAQSRHPRGALGFLRRLLGDLGQGIIRDLALVARGVPHQQHEGLDALPSGG